MYRRIGDNRKFESAALKILLLKDPNCCRTLFGENYNFMTIYAYALGIASVVLDYRILDSIKCRKGEYSFFEGKENYYTGTDEENINAFFDYYNDNIVAEVRKYDCKNELLLRKLDFSSEEQVVRSEDERQNDMDELEELLKNVHDSYRGFVLGTLVQVYYSNRRCRKLIQYIKDNPKASTSDIVGYTMEELGFIDESRVAELERYVDFGIDVNEDNFDCLGKWLCVSIPKTGYGLFSKDIWTSDELLSILEKYV